MEVDGGYRAAAYGADVPGIPEGNNVPGCVEISWGKAILCGVHSLRQCKMDQIHIPSRAARLRDENLAECNYSVGGSTNTQGIDLIVIACR